MMRQPVGPLAGIRIVEFGGIIAGAMPCRILADYGAEVIKVESAGRHEAPEAGGFAGYLGYIQLNRNKRNVTINLASEAGRSLARDLVARTDIVVENYSVDVMRRWGFTYDELCKVRSDLIMLDLQGLGQTGPDSAHVTFGANLMAANGMTYLWGHPEGDPTENPHSAFSDYICGMHAALAIMSAIEYRTRTGKGQHIDLAQIQALSATMGPLYMAAQLDPASIRPRGNRHPDYAPQGCYPCLGEDRWCAISITDDSEWRRLADLVGEPWATDPRFTSQDGRRAAHDEIDERLSSWTITKTPLQVAYLLQRVDVPAAPVYNNEDLFHDVNLRQRAFIAEVPFPGVGPLVQPGLLAKSSATSGHIWRRAPFLGEDNDYVFGEVLGLSTHQVQELQTIGAIA